MSFDYDGDSGPEVITISRRDVRARKAHTCDHCQREIPPGTTYVRTCQKVDGEMTVTTTHTSDGSCGWFA